jgi:tRNA nucleotidyltransferase/poly(A) polymerase
MTNRSAAIEIIRRLRNNGFRALLAGGCVRDMLLGRQAHDFDIATNAKPQDVIKLFKRTLKVGAKFGVVIVLLKDTAVEVATFRTEADYTDGRHPSKVGFGGADEDAARRDFTINAMFYDPLEKKVIDFFDGQTDLKKQIIRTVGDPYQRFSEDYLRMLRAVRFSTQLGFTIEPATKAAVCAGAGNITKISGERIAAELEGILVSPNRAMGASLLIETTLAEQIFPGFVGGNAVFGVEALRFLPRRIDFALGLSCLFAGCSAEFAMQKCEILKLSRNQNRHVEFLLDGRGKLLNEQMSLSELRLVLAEPCFDDLYALQKAIQKAAGRSVAPLIKLRRRISALGDIEFRPRPLLNGHDLIRLGAEPGPCLGQMAREMYIAQLEGHLRTAEQAREWVKHWLTRHKDAGRAQ